MKKLIPIFLLLVMCACSSDPVEEPETTTEDNSVNQDWEGEIIVDYEETAPPQTVEDWEEVNQGTYEPDTD